MESFVECDQHPALCLNGLEFLLADDDFPGQFEADSRVWFKSSKQNAHT